MPEVCAELEKEHAIHEQKLQEIYHFFHEARQTLDPVQKQNIAWTQYLLLNRFIAEYLQHLDKEETIIMPALWEKWEDEALLQPLQTFLASMKKEDLTAAMEDFWPAINPQEKANITGNI